MRAFATSLTSMATSLYIVVRHRKDADQPWANQWDDDDILAAITTTRDLAAKLAQANGEWVFVHRCTWGSEQHRICCAVRVTDVNAIDRGSALVRFNSGAVVDRMPPVSPARGQNWYVAPAIEPA